MGRLFSTMRIVALCVVGIVLPAIWQSARGAEPQPSFDCTRSSNYLETQICRSAELSQLDARLAGSYKLALENLSAEGRKSLRNSQRLWLRFVRTVCDYSKLPPKPWRRGESCIAEKFKERERQLNDAVVKVGAFTILRTDYLLVRRSSSVSDDSGHDAGFVTTQIAYPVMEGPDSPLKTEFNKTHAMIAMGNIDTNPEGTETDYWADYKTLKASPRMVSIEIDGGFYAHGTPHGLYHSSVAHWLLKEKRQLLAIDVFDSSKPWQRTVQSLCFDGLSKQLENWGEISDLDSFIDAVGEIPLNPERWVFEDEGLRIRFMPYEVAAYAAGAPEVLIPWGKLHDFLAVDAPNKTN